LKDVSDERLFRTCAGESDTDAGRGFDDAGYLDPPYWGCENDYGKAMFGQDDIARMAGFLARIKGRFILSINDVPEVRALFAGFQIAEVDVTYTVGRQPTARGARPELLICNFALSG
jgi:DNA adenine methylase